MKYLKSNWVEDDNFGADDINEIAKTVNELIDRQDKMINDSSKNDESAYSSDKIVKTADDAMASVIKNGQNGLKTTYSSSMILDIISMNKFRAVAIDTLPRTGNKDTVYLTPSETNTELLLESPLEIYEEDGEIIIDTDSNDGSLPYLKEGVVFKYKETSEETKKFLRTHLCGDLCFEVNIHEPVLEGEFEIGETFRAENGDYDDFVATDVDSTQLHFSYGNIYGITGYQRLGQGYIYKLVEYQKIEDGNVDEDDYYKDKYDTYVAIFECLPDDGSEVDHTVRTISSIFVKYKLPNKKNLMVTRINKNGLIGTSDYDYDIYGNVYKLNSDALKTIEPIDGHCYRVKELYTLKAKNIGGISSLYEIFYGNGAQIPVFEDVTRIAKPNIDDVRHVPGVITGFQVYCGRKSGGLYSLKDEDNNLYISYMDKSSEIPRNLKVGDILKAAGENPMSEDWTPFFYAKSASNVHATVNGSEIIWDGEIDMEEWETGECYEIKGFYRFGGDKLENNDSLGGDEEDMLVEFAIPIFEKKEDNNNYDYEVEILPFVTMSITGKVPAKESWVWINGEWEKIGGPNKHSLIQGGGMLQ